MATTTRDELFGQINDTLDHAALCVYLGALSEVLYARRDAAIADDDTAAARHWGEMAARIELDASRCADLLHG